MTRIDTDWLKRPETQGVLAMLTDAGAQAFVVGGAVRNALMGRPATDIDIATSAEPGEVVDLAGAAGFRSVPTGADHGTITVIVGETPFEVTTFRRDIETDGRHAVVAFSRDIADDAARRDFTINALYADASGAVTDLVGGLRDLEARRIVFVGDASARIEEDHLRSLRFFRFFAEYGNPETGLDPDALDAVASHLDGLDTLARERVGAEMRKLLAAPDPAPALAAMERTGALIRLLPGVVVSSVTPLVHLEEIAGVTPQWLSRLAVMGEADAANALRLSKKEARDLDTLQRHLSSVAGPAEIAWRHGPETAWQVALIRSASLASPLAPDLAQEIGKGAAATFPLSAKDLMPELDGPALGKALAEGERLWIASDFQMDAGALKDAVGKAG